MKKLVFIIILLVLAPLMGEAQELVSFKLQPNGSFLTEQNENYVIIPFEGKNEQEIYQLISTNIGSLFNDPSKVMSGVEFSFLKVRSIIPINKKIEKIFMLGDVQIEVDGYIQFEIKIRDGRVRVSSPYIENDVWIVGGASGSFSNIVSQWFKPEKKEKKRLENEKKIQELENTVNITLNSILGLYQNSDDENW